MVTRETAINTAKSFIRDCEKNGLKFRKVILFGSATKDQMHPGSDIDLLIVSDQFNNNVFDNLKLYSKINIRYPIIETHPYPTKHFMLGDDFIMHIQKEGIEIS
jgi:predicted nucleotidyltransferase